MNIYGTLAIIVVWLPGTINLPTFFRHSSNLYESIIALTIMTALHISLEISSLFVGFHNQDLLLHRLTSSNTLSFAALILFAVISYIPINLINLYFLTATWESVVSFFKKQTEFFITGVLGTLSYLLLISSYNVNLSVQEFESFFTGLISILGVVLLIQYINSIVLKHRPRFYDKLWTNIAWLIGSIVIFVAQVGFRINSIQAISAGIAASLIIFLVILFVEETVWSIKHRNS